MVAAGAAVVSAAGVAAAAVSVLDAATPRDWSSWRKASVRLPDGQAGAEAEDASLPWHHDSESSTAAAAQARCRRRSQLRLWKIMGENTKIMGQIIGDLFEKIDPQRHVK